MQLTLLLALMPIHDLCSVFKEWLFLLYVVDLCTRFVSVKHVDKVPSLYALN